MVEAGDTGAEARQEERSRKEVFYIYDETMMRHRDHNYQDEEGKAKTDLPKAREDDFISPEVPFRIKAIHDYLNANPSPAESLLSQMDLVEIKTQDWEQAVLRVHPQSHSDKIEETCARLGPNETSYELNEDNYECNETFSVASLSGQGCLTAVKQVLDGTYERGYCITRPPGHHAHSDFIQGFCFFNNVAVMAQYAVDQGKRVLIFDWDIHQGDGT